MRKTVFKSAIPRDVRYWNDHRGRRVNCVADRGERNAPVPGPQTEVSDDRSACIGGSSLTVYRVKNTHLGSRVIFEASDVTVRASILKEVVKIVQGR